MVTYNLQVYQDAHKEEDGEEEDKGRGSSVSPPTPCFDRKYHLEESIFESDPALSWMGAAGSRWLRELTLRGFSTSEHSYWGQGIWWQGNRSLCFVG